MPPTTPRPSGFSLLELNLVVATIAVVALLVAPARAPAETAQVEMVAIKLENALRFARDKAAQEQAFYGVRLAAGGRRVLVFQVDPMDTSSVLPAFNPLTKSNYRIDLGVENRAQFLWAGTGGVPAPVSVLRDGLEPCLDSTSVMFDPNGVTRCYDPYGARIQDVEVRTESPRSQLRLAIDSYTGRLTRR